MNDVDLNFRLSSTNFDDENARHPCHSVCLALPLIGHFPKLKPAQMKNTWNKSVVRMHATDVVSSPIFWLAVSPAWNASTRALVCCWWLCLLIYIENQAQHFPLFIYTTITTQTKTELYNIDCGGFSGKSVFQTMKRVCFTCVCLCKRERERVYGLLHDCLNGITYRSIGGIWWFCSLFSRSHQAHNTIWVRWNFAPMKSVCWLE